MIEPVRYDRSTLRTGVVHLGLGAFSRAHMLTYLDDLAAAGARDVGVVGAAMTSERVPDALRPQGCAYTLVEASAEQRRMRTIGVLNDVLGPSRRAELVAAIADPAVTLVTLTVTEKGYGLDSATGRLDRSDPTVAHDLAHPDRSTGTVGILIAGLAARRHRGGGPLTVVCCDVLAGSGHMLAGLVAEMADETDPGTAAWARDHVAFPLSMVDRMVPATTEALREETAAAGANDAWPVLAEPFRQWVLEDHLAPGTPDLGAVGVTLTDDVAGWERMKIRVLNGMHSACAYLGLRRGMPTIAAVVGDPETTPLLDALEREILAVLVPPVDQDAAAYGALVRRRFANPALGHRCVQIARDGSVKVAQRILPTVAAALDAGTPVDALARTVAWWVGHLRRTAAADLNDPRAYELRALVDRWRDGAGVAGALMALPAFAPERLRDDPDWRATLARAIDEEGTP